jgi:mono/diheme cytochrome c family protein
MRVTVARTAAALVLLTGLGCRRDMQDQPRYDAFERSSFFADGRASRPRVPGTVARGQLMEDETFFSGKAGATYAAAVPVPMTRALLERGQQRFDIYCSPCHDRVGTGQGIVVQRGYKRPTSFHDERLRTVPVGYFFDVMTNGFGTMPSYAPQVAPADRWAIASYIRALQRSQHATVADVPSEDRPQLDAAAALPSFGIETAPPIPPTGPGGAPAHVARPGNVEGARSFAEPGEAPAAAEPGVPGPRSAGNEGQPAKEGLRQAPHEGR